MRILIDTLHSQSRLTLNEIFYLDKSFQLLMNHYTQHHWMIETEGTTKGIISLLPVGIKKGIERKKLQPDVLISAGGDLSIQKSFKQIIFFDQHFDATKHPRIELDALHVGVTSSIDIQKLLIERYHVNSSFIKIIPAAVNPDITVADWSEKLRVKEKYADGRDFFLCFKRMGKNTQWEEILKAFSIFKKWQQSSFKLLIIATTNPSFNEEFQEKFSSYKYRTDVTILDPNREDIDAILPCAFAVICGDEDQTGLCMLNGFKAEVPVISSPLHVFDEEVSGAFLPAVPVADELSRQLINLYRDERMRDMIVQKGKEQLLRFSWEQVVAKWYDCISNVAS
jgi:hypothetical protein